MICENVSEALKAAERAKQEGLCGLYPSAAIVLSAEVQKLKDALSVIAYPRRGTPEEHWGVEEIGRFAGQFVERD